MHSVTQTDQLARAFYCTLYDLPGVLTKPGAAVRFLEPVSGAVITLTDADLPELIVLGDVALTRHAAKADAAARAEGRP